jgi:hypothetical protein
MTTTRGAFAQLLAPGLMEVMFNWLSMHPEEYAQYINVKDTARAYEEDIMVSTLGKMPTKPEGEPIKYLDPIQGGSIRYVPNAFGMGWRVTKEMMQDDQYNIISQMPQMFMMSLRELVEVTAAAVLNNAFSSTGTLTIDGLSLFNTAHPLLGGGTYSNRSATDAALSTTSLQELIILFEKMTNDMGIHVRSVPVNLWISPDKQFIAGEILNSQFKPYTGNNEVNVMQGRLEPAILHYLTATGPFFITANKAEHRMKFYWRQRPETENQDDFDTKSAKYSIFARFVAGATHWTGTAGSNGP